MRTVIPTRRSWFHRLLDAITDWQRHRHGLAALRALDARTLADIGIDASELSSITAESLCRAQRTRLRLAASSHHG